MAEQALIMPRRLAIEILHQAQIAQPQAIQGWVSADGKGDPAAFHAKDRPEVLWAQLWSNPLAPAIPRADELKAGTLHLVISLNTKGVLEMRAWELRNAIPTERVLKIHD